MIKTSKSRKPLNLLSAALGRAGSGELSGEFALPLEFDTREFAAQFSEKGLPARAAGQQQNLANTKYSAVGWIPWVYPAKRDTGEVDEKNNPIFETHPEGGKTHEVIAGGKTYVLLFRPSNVQKQVNEAFARVSTDRMRQELSGETAAGVPVEQLDPEQGVVTSERLERGTRLGSEDEGDEWKGESRIVDSVLPSVPTVLKGKPSRKVRN